MFGFVYIYIHTFLFITYDLPKENIRVCVCGGPSLTKRKARRWKTLEVVIS